jgi:hypothetical protein
VHGHGHLHTAAQRHDFSDERGDHRDTAEQRANGTRGQQRHQWRAGTRGQQWRQCRHRPTGPDGQPRPAGSGGKVELVTCKTVKLKHKTKQVCTTKLVTGPVKFTTKPRMSTRRYLAMA